MADEKAQKIYGKYIKELPQVTEVNDTDDIIVEDSTPITNRTKLGVIFDTIKSRIASTWKFSELGNKTILTYITELKAKAPVFAFNSVRYYCKIRKNFFKGSDCTCISFRWIAKYKIVRSAGFKYDHQ